MWRIQGMGCGVQASAEMNPPNATHPRAAGRTKGASRPPARLLDNLKANMTPAQKDLVEAAPELVNGIVRHAQTLQNALPPKPAAKPAPAPQPLVEPVALPTSGRARKSSRALAEARADPNVPRNRRVRRRPAAEEYDDAPAQPGEPPRFRVREMFFEVLLRFVEAVHQTFPECEHTADCLLQLSRLKGMQLALPPLIRAYHEGMKPFYDCIHAAMNCERVPERTDILAPLLNSSRRDPSATDEEEGGVAKILARIDFTAKWLELSDCSDPYIPLQVQWEQTRLSQDKIFASVHLLNVFARLHEALPPRVLRRIEKYAQDNQTSTDQQQTPADTIKVGYDILANLPKDEKALIVENLDVILEVIGGEEVITKMMSASGIKMSKINVPHLLGALRQMRAEAGADFLDTNFAGGIDAQIQALNNMPDDDPLLRDPAVETSAVVDPTSQSARVRANVSSVLDTYM